jgi:3,4-dihydroxy 2-butanone 4-phosphate synthase/GTP cyclohydrolase II
MALSSIEEAVEQLRRGGMVVVVDDEDRENEGDLVMPAQDVTAESMAFFLEYTSGVFCVPIESSRADALDLPLMVVTNTEAQRTAFTVTVDYRHGTSTGISAGDRAATVRALIDPETRPSDLNRPGHIFPLRYKAGGVLEARRPHRGDRRPLSPRRQAALGRAVRDRHGRQVRNGPTPELEAFAEKHHLPIVSIADLIRYRRHHEKLIKRVAEASLPTEWGQFQAFVFENVLDGEQHLAMVYGDVASTPERARAGALRVSDRRRLRFDAL